MPTSLRRTTSTSRTHHTIATEHTAPPRLETDLLEDAFVDWLRSDDKPQQVAIDGSDEPLQMTWLLGMVCNSKRRLPADAAAVLGMPGKTPTGNAATELLLAVNDPAGPRCRSYRSAATFLHDNRDLVIILDMD